MIQDHIKSRRNHFKTFSRQFSSFISYSTERSATIQSLKVGIVYRLAQILLLSYIIGWELLHNKGYQVFDHVSSSATTKVKGQGFLPINSTKHFQMNRNDSNYYEKLFSFDPNVSYHMLDTADYVIPPNEYNSVFIMTNFIKTEQKQDVCEEVPIVIFLNMEHFLRLYYTCIYLKEYSKYKAKCISDLDCQNLGPYINSWNGTLNLNLMQ